MAQKLYSRPSEVAAKAGKVVVKGPDHVDVEFTPDAADETGDRLIRKARDARHQANDG